MRIIIVADCVATQENYKEFINADTTALVGVNCSRWRRIFASRGGKCKDVRGICR